MPRARRIALALFGRWQVGRRRRRLGGPLAVVRRLYGVAVGGEPESYHEYLADRYGTSDRTRLEALAVRVFDGDQVAAAQWLDAYHPLLCTSPADLLERGEYDQVERILQALEHGLPR